MKAVSHITGNDEHIINILNYNVKYHYSVSCNI